MTKAGYTSKEPCAHRVLNPFIQNASTSGAVTEVKCAKTGDVNITLVTGLRWQNLIHFAQNRRLRMSLKRSSLAPDERMGDYAVRFANQTGVDVSSLCDT